MFSSWTLKIDHRIKAFRWWKFVLQNVPLHWLEMESDKALHLKRNQKLFSFGLIADVQYADIEDRLNYSKTKMRYYRNALSSLQDAVRSWNESPEDLCFVVQLGDLLDGFNLEKGKENSSAAANLLLLELARATAPVHNVLGNHEVYNFTRRELFERGFYSGYELGKKGKYMKTSSASQRPLEQCRNGIDQSFEEFCRPLGVSSLNYPSFYQFSPFEGFRVLFIDTYDLSVLGYETDSEMYKKSHQILRSVNKNDEWNSPNNLGFGKSHFVGFNGGVGDRQLKWLKEQLADATAKNEKVLIFAHCPIHPRVSGDHCLVWNYQEVLAVLHQSNSVVAVFCGHTHVYAYAVDDHGIHHVVLPGVVEIPPGANGYATVDVYHDQLHVRGVGAMPSLTLDMR